jgi:phosphate starvation-inducible membrane PsiE
MEEYLDFEDSLLEENIQKLIVDFVYFKKINLIVKYCRMHKTFNVKQLQS